MRDEANDNVKGRTPLMLAAFRGDTALMFAAYKGHALVVALLLQYGASVYARARNGWTAKKAAQSGLHEHIADMLQRAETEGAPSVLSFVN